MKICRVCLINQELIEFNVRSTSKDGLNNRCKTCEKAYHEKYRELNKEKLHLKNKKHRLENKNYHEKYHKEYKLNNVNKLKEYYQDYYQLNKEKINNKIKLKLKNDDLFRLKHNLRCLIGVSLKNKGVKKTSKTQEILGCTFEEFKFYLEFLWEPWMNWDNYGLYEPNKLNYGWDIDHIIPLKTGKTEENIIKLNHYLNLQPLCSKINRDVKHDKTH